MAHFVEIDSSNIVIRGLVLADKDTQDESGNEVESVGAKYLGDGFGGTWKRTSYNTFGGVHKLGGTPYRKNYAGIGYTFDKTRDAFIPKKPFPSWTVNEETCHWVPPTAMPADGKMYDWNESKKKWMVVK